MPYKSLEDQKRYARAHYEANKPLYKARAVIGRRQTRMAIRSEIRRLKDVPCTDCSKRYPHYVMQFDHVADGKEFTIGRSDMGSVAVLLREVEKCEVVCANCHAERTWNRAHGGVAQVVRAAVS